ncbi:hypothetical protein KR009_010802 [Drosophila setifemur]|nr:hypothetical protein KR009_010802 [Drosophila setifemur]
MGLKCAKLPGWCSCCCSSCCPKSSPAPEEFQVLVLGPAGCGKTELGHRLQGSQRSPDDQEPTNGVRCYSILPEGQSSPEFQLQLTEVGGNREMQRLWRHYYSPSHALIYCFNLGQSPEELELTFSTLRSCLEGTEMSGKPVLLVASRFSEGVQLYDVEYAFGLEQLASSCGCPLLTCHMDDPEDLRRGIRWMCQQLLARKPELEQRIRYDMNMQVRVYFLYFLFLNYKLIILILFQVWQRRKRLILSSGKLVQVHRQRFRRPHRKVVQRNP